MSIMSTRINTIIIYTYPYYVKVKLLLWIIILNILFEEQQRDF